MSTDGRGSKQVLFCFLNIERRKMKLKIFYKCNQSKPCKESCGCIASNPEGYVCEHTKSPEFAINQEYTEAMSIILNHFDIGIEGTDTIYFREK